MNTKQYRKQIGKLIYSLRWENRMRLSTLASKCGRSLLQVRNIENGKVDTKISTLSKIAEVFNLSPAQFLAAVESKELKAEK